VGGRDWRDVSMQLATGLLTTACLQRHDQRRSPISPVGPVVNDGGHDSNNTVYLTYHRSRILAVKIQFHPPAKIPL
jgi:hypothetical protein